ncbi:MAG: alpha/beta fold hydrolase [Burkholderiaceae bacterium]
MTRLHGGHISSDGVRIHFLRFGGYGVPLLIVPGITSPAETWDFVGERLGRRFDTFIIDVRGRGLSQADDGLDYSTEACAKDVQNLAAALGLRRYLLLGHSMGARIGARVASSYSAGLAALILADPPVSGPGRRPYPKTLQPYLDAIDSASGGRMAVADVQAAYPTWSESQCWKRVEWLHTCNKNAVAKAHAAFHDEDFFDDVSATKVAALLIAAGRGDVIRPEDVEELKARLPALETVTLPQSGHMLPFDAFDAFVQAVEQFFGSLDGSGAQAFAKA